MATTTIPTCTPVTLDVPENVHEALEPVVEHLVVDCYALAGLVREHVRKLGVELEGIGEEAVDEMSPLELAALAAQLQSAADVLVTLQGQI